MAKKLAYERYLWFHARLKSGRYPTLRQLAEKFEISNRQAAREIDFMRLFFSAPIAYSSERNGYYYSQAGFEMPGVWITDEEFLSLLIAKRLAAAIPDRGLKKTIDSHLHKICQHVGIDFGRFEQRVSLKNVRYYRVRPEVFAVVVPALSLGRKLRLRYRSIHTGQTSERIVSPLHLLLYMGNWHLLAHCETRRGLRNFALSRILEIEPCAEAIDPRLGELDIKKLSEENYGIFLTGTSIPVVLRFSPEVAGFVGEQVWYPGQSVKIEADGSLLLSFPVVDLREVLRDVLPFGAAAEVLAPPELRRQVADTAARMAALYEKNGTPGRP